MAEFPETRDSLILQVRDPSNRRAWEEFEQLYRPVIFRMARAKGLQHADAMDLVQQVLLSVLSAIDRFQQREHGGGFRRWLSRVTRNAVLKSLSRPPRDRASGGPPLDALTEAPADPDTDALWQLEYRRELFHRAADEVRGDVQEATWLAFELTALQHTPVDRAAEMLEVSTGSVYAARSRIMRRIRDAVDRLHQCDLSGDGHECD